MEAAIHAEQREHRNGTPPTLLESITEFCRTSGVAESTFGRRAVNDGKLVSRLREGARIRPETLARLHAFMRSNGVRVDVAAPPELLPLVGASDRPAIAGQAISLPPIRLARPRLRRLAASASSTTVRSTSSSSPRAARRT